MNQQITIDEQFTDIHSVLSHSKKLLAIYHSGGFRIFQTEKLLQNDTKAHVIRSKNNLEFGINQFSFIYDCMMFILVPNNLTGRYTSNNVIIWDEEAQDNIIEIIDFCKPILSVAHVKEFLAVASVDRISLYDMNKLQTIRYVPQSQGSDINIECNLNYDTFTIIYQLAQQKIGLINFWYPLNGPFEIDVGSFCEESTLIKIFKMNYDGTLIALVIQTESKDKILIYSSLNQCFKCSIENDEGGIIGSVHFDKNSSNFMYFVSIQGKSYLKITTPKFNDYELCFTQVLDTQLQQCELIDISIDSLSKDNELTIFLTSNSEKQQFHLSMLTFSQDQTTLAYSKQLQFDTHLLFV